MDPREDLVRHYRWLRQYGLNDSHSGNASVRVESDLWVTPSGCCADTLQADMLMRSPIDGDPYPGASLDTRLHQLVYRTNPDVGAVLHSHGPNLVAITLNGCDFIPPDFEGQYYFKKIPVVSIPYDRYVAQAPELIAELLHDYPIAIVRGHGVYARGETINQAYKWSCSAELSAKTAILARQAGTLDKI